jgi:hypothetical protein
MAGIERSCERKWLGTEVSIELWRVLAKAGSVRVIRISYSEMEDTELLEPLLAIWDMMSGLQFPVSRLRLFRYSRFEMRSEDQLNGADVVAEWILKLLSVLRDWVSYVQKPPWLDSNSLYQNVRLASWGLWNIWLGSHAGSCPGHEVGVSPMSWYQQVGSREACHRGAIVACTASSKRFEVSYRIVTIPIATISLTEKYDTIPQRNCRRDYHCFCRKQTKSGEMMRGIIVDRGVWNCWSRRASNLAHEGEVGNFSLQRDGSNCPMGSPVCSSLHSHISDVDWHQNHHSCFL